MADENKPQLTEDEKIERKAKLFRIISRILIVVSVIVIGVFIYYAIGTKENIATQTAFDTEELRSKIKQIINLEIRYHQQHGEYAGFKYLQLSKELSQYNPAIAGNFKYKFDPDTGTATGQEKDASHDVNGDVDGNDGLTLSVNWEADVQEGSKGGDFFWTDEDIAYFEKRKAQAQ
ncbi:MAG: hypothetical protein HOC71_13585 [Candidatus Latescibacteria bacterium]|jgi:hypothetical protein|nr:hypothetical protein [Candidatus Latescibacterota bacterium]